MTTKNRNDNALALLLHTLGLTLLYALAFSSFVLALATFLVMVFPSLLRLYLPPVSHLALGVVVGASLVLFSAVVVWVRERQKEAKPHHKRHTKSV
jgi:uncharacterized membrane protein